MPEPETHHESARQLIRARYAAPMNGAGPDLIENAAILIENGKIAAIGRASEVIAASSTRSIDLGDAVLLPGLVNAHAHLELSLFSAGPPTNFADWLLSLINRNTNPIPDPVAAMTEGLRQSLRFGGTTIGDLTRDPAATRPYLAKSPFRAVSFGEVRAMSNRRPQLGPMLDAALNAGPPGDHPRLQYGITPHAPYSVEPDAYRACIAAARKQNLSLTTHLAESPDEAEFLATHTGPLRELWNNLGWDENVPRFEGGPIRFAESLGLLTEPAILAHVNYCDDAELDTLARGRASVAYCPRTHKHFGHPPHRFREMLARNINVAVGTDSCASSPDLNLLDDLRLIHQIAPEMSAAQIFDLATRRAAVALGFVNICGSLATRKAADLISFNLSRTQRDPLTGLLESAALPDRVWIDGREFPNRP